MFLDPSRPRLIRTGLSFVLALLVGQVGLAADKRAAPLLARSVDPQQAEALATRGGAVLAPIQDPGFELGHPNPFWSETTSSTFPIIYQTDSTPLPVPQGGWVAWFGGVATIEAGTLTQTIFVGSQLPHLEFDLAAICGAGTSDTDFVAMQLDGQEIFRLDAESQHCDQGFLHFSVDLGDLADDSFRLFEVVSEIQGTPEISNFLLDDLALTNGGAPAVFQVTDLGDSSAQACTAQSCSLREAVLAANAHPGPDRIEIPPGNIIISQVDRGLGELDGDFDIFDDVTIVGAGSGVTTIDGNRLDRVFEVHEVEVTLRGLTITGGLASLDGGGGGGGGGVLSSGDLRVNDVEFASNSAFEGGGIGAAGPLSIRDSRFHHNDAVLGGAIVSHFGPLTIVRTRIHDNVADEAAIFISEAEVLIDQSEVSTNHGWFGVGGLALFGGAGTLRNSTVSGNTTAGLDVRNLIAVSGVNPTEHLLVEHVTFVGNAEAPPESFGEPVGIELLGSGHRLAGSIFADTCRTHPGAVESLGGNLQVLGDSCFGGAAMNGDLTFVLPEDVGLEPLADNGGPTLTHQPAETSAADRRSRHCSTYDQRGVLRLQGDLPFCTAGAVENDYFCDQLEQPIPDGDPEGLTTGVEFSGYHRPLIDLQLFLELEHQSMGDLRISLENQATQTEIVLVDQADNCQADDLNVIVSDRAPTELQTGCATGDDAQAFPLPEYRPSDPNGGSMADFRHQVLDGTWQIRIADLTAGQTGTLKRWCFFPNFTLLLDDGFETGDTSNWTSTVP